MEGSANYTAWWLKVMKFKFSKIGEFLTKHKDVLEGAARRCIMSHMMEGKEHDDDEGMEDMDDMEDMEDMEDMFEDANATMTREDWEVKLLALKFKMMKKALKAK